MLTFTKLKSFVRPQNPAKFIKNKLQFQLSCISVAQKLMISQSKEPSYNLMIFSYLSKIPVNCNVCFKKTVTIHSSVISHRSKSISFWQNDPQIGESFWQNDSLITHILFNYGSLHSCGL